MNTSPAELLAALRAKLTTPSLPSLSLPTNPEDNLGMTPLPEMNKPMATLPTLGKVSVPTAADNLEHLKGLRAAFAKMHTKGKKP